MQWRNVPVKREIRKKIRFLLREPFCGGCAAAHARPRAHARWGEVERISGEEFGQGEDQSELT